MSEPETSSDGHESVAGSFATTHWSVVLAAGGDGSPQAQEALARLCETYWYPLYAFVRRQGHSPHDAEDLTQEFFARLVRSHFFTAADPQRGRFRSFLLGSLKHFLAHEWQKGKTLKRGGGRSFVSLDAREAESRFGLEPVEPMTPDQVYERRWALTLLERVLDRLRRDYAAGQSEGLFDALKPALTGQRELGSYADLAGRLGLSEGALKVAVHRLRQRYGALLREEIAQTVARPDEIEEELRHLLQAL